MSVFIESRIEFDFTDAIRVVQHDKPVPGHGNTVWPGTDFCIKESVNESIWLEVKNWDPTHIAPKDRGGCRWSFICKMKSKTFAKDMRNKFLGTTAFLAWTDNYLLEPTKFVLLFQPPHTLDVALLGTLQTRLQSQIPNLSIWQASIRVSILDVGEWNMRFSQFPARLL